MNLTQKQEVQLIQVHDAWWHGYLNGAAKEKSRLNVTGYQPTVSVKIRKVEGKVKVSVEDNSSGTPQEVLDKIFQPFFTTKPTGKDTGLDLSLSYDIVKTHNGILEVDNGYGAGTTFTIGLPLES